ncbi:hypothetical protein K469DRAFT_688537 [Zopfia rhizophila CBS 207.26]|uniref:Uncharacterized protein n=1 Tax=Zopfia rhizophila CBS 207.26 TaxID=1314779 RepID=A0A6A6E201_9PEZI|nr:hypothetical protein K469DRAFT_688537 [Zopfia rhizophila CBS 207.26]
MDDDNQSNAEVLLQDVFTSLSRHASKDVFAIGGKIDPKASQTLSTVDQGQIVIRWDSGEWKRGCKVSLPPATYGKGKEEVLDEEYRKAGKMDVTEFCTNFNLAQHGIIESIYSSPSGKFKSHVDTPRSDAQMGSLVDCLPYAHQGGALAVRHGGREVLFDWSSKIPASVQWAAFFSRRESEDKDGVRHRSCWELHGAGYVYKEQGVYYL